MCGTGGGVELVAISLEANADVARQADTEHEEGNAKGQLAHHGDEREGLCHILKLLQRVYDVERER